MTYRHCLEARKARNVGTRRCLYIHCLGEKKWTRGWHYWSFGKFLESHMDFLQIRFGRHSDGRHPCWSNLCSFHSLFHLQNTRPSPDTLNIDHLEIPWKYRERGIVLIYPYQRKFCGLYILSRTRMSIPWCRRHCWRSNCGCHNTRTRPTISPRSTRFRTIPTYPLDEYQWKIERKGTHRKHHPIRVYFRSTPPTHSVFPGSKTHVS